MFQRCGMIALAGLLTISLQAQTPVRRSVGLDLGALATDEVRFGLEPMVFGRWSLHMSLARWADGFAAAPPEFVRTSQAAAAGLESVPGSTELSLDVTLRVYPRALASDVPAHRFRTYAGLGAGLRQRTNARFGPNFCTIRCVQPVATVDRRRGVDPLVEAGVRFEPATALLLDIGIRTRLVAFDDPTGRFTTGDLDPRVVVALGFRW